MNPLRASRRRLARGTARLEAVRRQTIEGAIGCLLLLVIGCSCGERGGGATAQFVRRTEWIGKGVWLKADLHMHSRFSDGAREPADLVAKAVEYGCDVVAITDHGDHDLRGASPEYFQAIATLRQQNPNLIILAGLEWNVPPGGGDDHAGVLVPPGPDESRVLSEFKSRFDDLGREHHEAELAYSGLRWLSEQAASWSVAPVIIFNHPSRRVAKSLDNLDKLRRLRGVNPLVIGMEGAPGHQRATPLGSYDGAEQTIDRWDPVAARIGDVWDQMLQGGEDCWGAFCFSDFHNDFQDDLNDFWPGQFSETWLYAPERTPAGVLQALRAGSFFAGHGAIVREATLTVNAPGLDRPASAGECIDVPKSSQISARVEIHVPATDWAGEPNRIDTIELIAIDSTGARILASRPPAAGAPIALEESIEVPAGGLVLRARGRRVVADGPDYCFYTNPIRIRVRS